MYPRKKGFLFLFLLSFALLAAGSATLTSVSAQAYENPHGPYGAFPAGCAACHVAHASPGASLLKQPTITSLCLACHDGTASSYDVVNAVYAGFSSTCGAEYYHPVMGVKDLLNNPAVGETIQCVHCHNPHGDMSEPGKVYPRLLNSSDGTSRYYQGPDYCLACHGAVDHNFTGDTDTYWEDTLGDHRNPSAAHYLTAAPELLPASGTEVTCVKCHNKHAAPNERLLAQAEENLCWSCHVKEGEKFGSIHPVRAFSKTGSLHNVDGAGGSKLECSSCHGPHTANYMSFSVNGPGVYCYQCHPWAPGQPITTNNPYSLQGPYSVLSDPDNTKKGFSGAAGTGLGGTANTVGDLNDFCIKCHDGSPPTAVATVYEFVPYTVVFSETAITTNSGGWDKDGYKTTGHGTRTITCGDCHESHGSDYPALQRYAEDTDEDNGECLRCHNGSYTGAADVKTALISTSRHPTLYISGKHRNTEDYENMPVEDRHAECADCHDPHQCDDTTAAAPAKYGSLKGVSGVLVDYGTATWSNWPGDATFSLKLGIDYQYELCFKCHSRYSYGTNPPTWPSRPSKKETDQAREFNPANASYHAVVGGSKATTYGKYVGPWSYDSRVYCTDCHCSDNTSVKGPHGSANTSILYGDWTWHDTDKYTGTGGKRSGDTSSHLCFKCHDYTFYTDSTDTQYNNDTAAGYYSSFSAANAQYHPPHKYNYHVRHKDVACAVCHSAIPHGYKDRSLLVQTSETNKRYSIASGLKIDTFQQPAQWRCCDCHHGM